MNRITRTLTTEEQRKLVEQRHKLADELPDLIARDRCRRDAAQEKTLSGAVRRIIHSSGHTIDQLSVLIGIDPILLDDFLTGERPLSSDVMDRLAQVLNCEANLVVMS